MGNQIFEALMIEKIDVFVNLFKSTAKTIFYDDKENKLIQPGEFGMYRENICKDFLKYFIPMRIGIGQGFLMNTLNKVSTQTDLVFFDKFSTPLFENEEKQRFYPVETVAAIGEVKSVLNKTSFKEAINKLARTKKLREGIKNPVFIKRNNKLDESRYDPEKISYDAIFSFILCERLDFKLDNIVNDINDMYDNSNDFHQRHNLILSIDDGILLYYDDHYKSMMYPFIHGKKLKNRFTKKHENPYTHFKLFLAYLFLGTESATILYPEITDYMGSIEGGLNYNE